MTQEEYMRLALLLAQEAADAGEVPVGCIVVDGAGRIIGRGRNRREENIAVTGHAELEAMEQAAQALGSMKIFSVSSRSRI